MKNKTGGAQKHVTMATNIAGGRCDCASVGCDRDAMYMHRVGLRTIRNMVHAVRTEGNKTHGDKFLVVNTLQ